MFRLVVIALMLLASPAHAIWNKASSDHFIVYSEGPAQAVGTSAESWKPLEASLRRAPGDRLSPEPTA
ncbi:MAG: hypothetical protein ACOYLK_02465 [Sphingomonas sp.]